MNKIGPGIYLWTGGDAVPIKSASVISQLLNPSVLDAATLANSVSWSYIALRTRRVRIREFAHHWERNGTEQDSGLADWLRLAPRIDEAVQLFGQAWLYKVRDGMGRVIALKWLDPRTMELPPDAVRDDGTIAYWWRTVNSKRVDVPGDDVIHIIEHGIPEVHPDQPAAEAARNVLQGAYNLERVFEFVTRNPTPVGLLVIPTGTPPVEREKLRAWFRRILNPESNDPLEQRVEPVSEGVTFQPLSFEPSQLAQQGADTLRVQSILAAYGVPASEVLDSAANYATAQTNRRRFLSELGGAVRMYAGVINADPDVQRAGWRIVVRPEQHQDLQADELEIAQALAVYVKAGLTPQAAAYRLGIQADDFPPEIGDPFSPVAPVQAGTGLEPMQDASGRQGTGVAAHADLDDAALTDLARWQLKALHAVNKGQPPAVEFESDHIPPALAGAIAGQLEQAQTPADVMRVFRWAGYP